MQFGIELAGPSAMPDLPSIDLALAACTALGLAAGCGFRAFVPVLALGVAGRAGIVALAPGLGWLAGTPALALFALAAGLEVGLAGAARSGRALVRVAAGALAGAGVGVELAPEGRVALVVLAGLVAAASLAFVAGPAGERAGERIGPGGALVAAASLATVALLAPVAVPVVLVALVAGALAARRRARVGPARRA
jgi:hypothetical protein